MTTITIALDERTVQQAEQAASDRRTTLDRLIGRLRRSACRIESKVPEVGGRVARASRAAVVIDRQGDASSLPGNHRNGRNRLAVHPRRDAPTRRSLVLGAACHHGRKPGPAGTSRECRSHDPRLATVGAAAGVHLMLEAIFPRLASSAYAITSPKSDAYNCIAWAASDVHHWWWPVPAEETFWPLAVPREATLEAFVAAFATLGI